MTFILNVVLSWYKTIRQFRPRRKKTRMAWVTFAVRKLRANSVVELFQ